MLIIAVTTALSKKFKAHIDDPSKMFEIICDKYDKKGNNKISNLCKELESYTLRNTKVDLDGWFADLYCLSVMVEKVIT